MTLRRCGRPRHLQQLNRHRQGHLGQGPDLESPDANQKSWRDALAKKRERREFAIHSPGKHEENVCCAPLLGATQPVFQKMKQPAKGRHAAQAYIEDPASRKRLSAAGPACCSKAPGRASERVATSGCSAAPLPAERPHACEKSRGRRAYLFRTLSAIKTGFGVLSNRRPLSETLLPSPRPPIPLTFSKLVCEEVCT